LEGTWISVFVAFQRYLLHAKTQGRTTEQIQVTSRHDSREATWQRNDWVRTSEKKSTWSSALVNRLLSLL